MVENSNSTLVPTNQQTPVGRQRSATKQLERAKRQAILMQIIEKESSNNNTPTFADLSKLMRKNSWIQVRWPEYTMEMARYDFGEIMVLTRDDIKNMAMPYLARQLNLIDETTDILKKIVDDDARDDDTRIKAANTLRGYTGEIAKIFALYAPKETHVKKQEVIGTIDDFLKLRAQVNKELKEFEETTESDNDDKNIEEGEYEPVD